MPKIVYIEANGREHPVDVPESWTLMEGAVNAVPGIDADCGGACACATCHVYVDPQWLERLGPRNDMERSMLEFAEDVRPSSRLACQIKVTAELEGLIVRTPASQH